MTLTDTLPEILTNVLYLEKMLSSKKTSERDKAVDLIKRGESFLLYTIDNKTLFAPSRFIGYKNNSISGHITGKPHGSYTSTRITKILGQKPLENIANEKDYKAFCKLHGIIPNPKGNFGKERKFWDLDKLTTDVYGDIELSEGRKKYSQHLRRERNPRIRQIVISNFLHKHKKLYCEACDFEFGKKYGKIGDDFIECHHTIPLSKMPEGHMTKPEDIVLLCSNCHRIIHKPKIWMTLQQLKEVIRENSNR